MHTSLTTAELGNCVSQLNVNNELKNLCQNGKKISNGKPQVLLKIFKISNLTKDINRYAYQLCRLQEEKELMYR